jgi:hypothetical protein
MDIIAHRGYWNANITNNSWQALTEATAKGYAVETDFRDCDGELVISHDMPIKKQAFTAEAYFKTFNTQQQALPHALNVKADGLQNILASLMQQYHLRNSFVFDMSIPDMLRYINLGITTYARLSEYETTIAFEDKVKGIWLDAFNSIWYANNNIEALLNRNYKVCIVSPDLHKRPHLDFWQELAQLKTHTYFKNLQLCTDFPDEAKAYFNL